MHIHISVGSHDQFTPESKIANAIHRAYLDSGGADLLRACTLVVPILNLDSCLSTIPAIYFHTTRYTYFCRLRDWLPQFFSAVVVWHRRQATGWLSDGRIVLKY